MPKATIKNSTTGITKAVSPKIPNITSLMAFPTIPIIPKLHKNKKTDTANKAISHISLLIAESIGSLFLTLLVEVEDLLYEVPDAVFLLPEFPPLPVFFFFVCAILQNPFSTS